MERKNDVPGRPSAATPAAVLGCILFVAAVVFATVHAGFAAACYCSPCSYESFGDSKITSSGRYQGCENEQDCEVWYTQCTPAGCVADGGGECIPLPSNPCSVMLCEDK